MSLYDVLCTNTSCEHEVQVQVMRDERARGLRLTVTHRGRVVSRVMELEAKDAGVTFEGEAAWEVVREQMTEMVTRVLSATGCESSPIPAAEVLFTWPVGQPVT